MNSRHLVDRFAAARERGESLVLVTVYATLGSTYSKAGTRMLILPDGRSQGLVSGGCLESDLAERARQVLASGRAATVTYDLRDEADELFGLGIGCNGLISVLLQPLTPANAYEPLASIAEVLLGTQTGAIASVIESVAEGSVEDEGTETVAGVGTTLVKAGGQARPGTVPAGLAASLEACCDASLEAHRAALVSAAGLKVLQAPLVPIPRVLILGAGLDAVPLVNVIAELGWRVTIADHRPAYLARGDLGRAEASLVLRPQELGQRLALADFDVIIVMSHHLQTDLEYLRQLATTQTRYVGVLGPPARRQRLLEDLGADGAELAKRLRGPVGIDIGADSAESIAVSIAAELQSVLVRDV